MKALLTGTAGKLIAFTKAAFLMQQAWTRPTGTSKRHPVGDASTGHEAAIKYATRRSFSPARASTLRKVDRVHRIWNGTAPLKHDVPGRRETTIIKRAERREKIEEARAVREAKIAAKRAA